MLLALEERQIYIQSGLVGRVLVSIVLLR
eukprot:COSAG06_NODE_3494_length_5266_cov_74.842849_1_plen_28_part_10